MVQGRWLGAWVVMIGLVLPSAGYAAPSVSFTAHRGTAGGSNPAPLYVHFDATATTSSIGGDKPFFDLLYEWDFADTTAGNWATDGQSKNRAFGGVAGHVFEKPGTYVVRLTVTDRSGASSSTTRTIVVDDPAVVWSGKTACVSATGNFAGCPAGAGASQVTASNSCTGIKTAQNAGFRRVLLRRGDTFTSGFCETTNAATTMIGAFGDPAQPRPRINMNGPDNRAAISIRGNDTRVVDLDIQDTGTPMFGVESAGASRDILVLRTRVQTRDQANVFFPTNGPDGGTFPLSSGAPVSGVLYYVAIVDNDLRGTTSQGIGGGGTCYYGGAVNNMFSGNRCGRGTSWQVRIIFNDRSVFQHNIIEENAGAFESVKYHCAGGAGVLCRFNVFSDNVLAKERLNVTSGSASDGNIITDSVFERNKVSGEMVMEQPGNMFRFNVTGHFRLANRVFDIKLSRNNLFVNNTCFDGGRSGSCLATDQNSDATGSVMRNNLFYAVSAPGPAVVGGAGVGTNTVLQENNRVVTGGASPFVSGNPQALRDFALPTGSTLIDAGKVGVVNVDLLSNPAPRGGGPDIGAVEFGSGPVVVDAPPQPPVLLSVDVQ